MDGVGEDATCEHGAEKKTRLHRGMDEWMRNLPYQQLYQQSQEVVIQSEALGQWHAVGLLCHFVAHGPPPDLIGQGLVVVVGLDVSEAPAEARQEHVHVVEDDGDSRHVVLGSVGQVPKQRGRPSNLLGQRDHVGMKGVGEEAAERVEAGRRDVGSLGLSGAGLEEVEGDADIGQVEKLQMLLHGL